MHPKLEKYLMGSRFAGIEAEMTSNGCLFHLVIVKRSHQKLAIEKCVTGFATAEELKLNLPKDLPCAVVFTGKGVLNRYVQAAPGAEAHILMGKVLPNASAKDFYVAATPSTREGQIVTVVRKTTISSILEQFQNIDMVSSSIGPSVAGEFMRMINRQVNILNCGNHTMQFEDEFLTAISYSENQTNLPEFEFGDEKVSFRSVIALAAAFTSAVGGHGNQCTQIEISSDGRDNYLQRKLFKASVKTVLVGTLLILIVNYFAFSHYWKLQEEHSAQLLGQGNNIAEVNEMEMQVQAKNEFLVRAGLLNQSSYAWYADQLAHSMPEGINLSRLNFSPRIKVANEDSIGFNSGWLEISGRCEESVELNTWLQELKTQKWITSATIRSYQRNKTMNEGEFTLDLALQ